MQFSAVSSFYNTLNKVHGVTKELLQINFMYIPAPNIITFERACVSLYTPFMRNEQKSSLNNDDSNKSLFILQQQYGVHCNQPYNCYSFLCKTHSFNIYSKEGENFVKLS